MKSVFVSRGNSIKQSALGKYLYLACIHNYPKKTSQLQCGELLQRLLKWPSSYMAYWLSFKDERNWEQVMCWRSHHLWQNRVPEQRGSYTFLSLQGETTTTTSRGYCSVPAVSVPAMEHFQTATVKHLERLSWRGKKNCKNHTTKIYSRNVFPKLTLYSQNSEGPKAILGTFAFWFCRLALCFNFTLFCIFTGKECFIRCPQNFFYFCMISIIQTLPTSL